MSRTVLIADDDPMIHLVLGETMRAAGWKVHQANDGSEAIAIARTTTFDAIVLDVRMPGLDGVSVAGALRARPQNAKVPIILMSAERDDATRLRGIFAGADDFVPKPFRTRELIERISSVIRMTGGTAPPVTPLADDETALWVEVDASGHVQAVSPLCAATLGLPASSRGLQLGAYLDALYELHPAESWDDLFVPMPSGFRRVMSRLPHTGARPLAFEVQVRPGSRDDRVRVMFDDITESVATARAFRPAN